MAETRTSIFSLPQYSDEVVDGPSMADFNEAFTNIESLVAARASLGARNVLRNPSFEVWQRGIAAAVTTSGSFSADGWKLSAVGGTISATQTALGLGLVPTARYAHTLATTAQSAAGDYSILSQSIESVFTLAGQAVTVSFWAKAGTGTPKIGVELSQAFGTGGAPSASVSVPLGFVTLSTTWTRYSVTGTLASITAKTLGSNGDHALVLYLWGSSGATNATRASAIGIQNSTISVTQVQVEQGGVLSPVEQRSLAAEYLFCQRYFWRRPGDASGSLPGFTGGVITATNSANIPIQFPTEMRIAPAIASSGTISIFDGTSTASASGVTLPNKDTRGAVMVVPTSTSPFVIGRACYMIIGTAASYVELSAEL